jgi:hypothetical protein
MTQIIKRALPFALAFVFGVTCTAIFRIVVPSRRATRLYDMSWSHCRSKERKNPAFDRFVPVQDGTFDITEIQYSGWTGHAYVTFSGHSASTPNLTAKEQALLMTTGEGGLGSSTNFLVSYVSPDSLDGRPVTSDARLIDIPRPAFWREEQNERWREEQNERKVRGCNAIVRAELDSSGIVSNVSSVPGIADDCSYMSDILDAARNIKFTPALRNDLPVSQRISILYRLH